MSHSPQLKHESETVRFQAEAGGGWSGGGPPVG